MSVPYHLTDQNEQPPPLPFVIGLGLFFINNVYVHKESFYIRQHKSYANLYLVVRHE